MVVTPKAATRMEKGEIITLSTALLKFFWPFVCPPTPSLLAIFSLQFFSACLSVKDLKFWFVLKKYNRI